MTEKRCKELFWDAELEVIEVFTSQDVREGRAGEKWVNIIGMRK